MKVLRVQQVKKAFADLRTSIPALSNISFTAHEGEFIALVGPSGCGKSTLLRLVAGLLHPDFGTIQFEGWQGEPKSRLVFQDAALFPWMNVADNVAFGLEMDGILPEQRCQKVYDQLSAMGMADFMSLFPYQLSGGMQQRAAIARAFVTSPDILLMDEPLRALDAQMRLVIQEELLTMWESRRPIVLYVTHDIDEALLLADRILVFSGKPSQIKEIVQSPFTRPRDLSGRSYPQLEELKWHIWSLLENDVRQQLSVVNN
jgi:NitT/TauT family transport system ATP-binding protein